MSEPQSLSVDWKLVREPLPPRAGPVRMGHVGGNPSLLAAVNNSVYFLRVAGQLDTGRGHFIYGP